MKIHWRTEDRWLREFRQGQSFADIAWGYAACHDRSKYTRSNWSTVEIEDGIRRAILRRERRKRNTLGRETARGSETMKDLSASLVVGRYSTTTSRTLEGTLGKDEGAARVRREFAPYAHNQRSRDLCLDQSRSRAK